MTRDFALDTGHKISGELYKRGVFTINDCSRL